MLIKELSACVLSFLLINLISPDVGAAEIVLKTAGHVSEPKYFPAKSEDGEVHGMCVDIMKAIEKIDPDIRFNISRHLLPIKRLLRNVETGRLDVVFGINRTKARDGIIYRYPKTPLYPVSWVFGMNKHKMPEISSWDDVNELNSGVLIQMGGIYEKFMKDNGIKYQVAKDPKQLLTMLLFERIQIVMYHDLGLVTLAKQPRFADKIIIVGKPFLRKTFHWAAFSMQTPPHVVEKVNAALRTLDRNGELDRIFKNYVIY